MSEDESVHTAETEAPPAESEPTPAELEDPRAAATAVDQKRTPPCPPEPAAPRLLTAAEAVALRAALPHLRGAARARAEQNLDTYDCCANVEEVSGG